MALAVLLKGVLLCEEIEAWLAEEVVCTLPLDVIGWLKLEELVLELAS